MGYLISRRDGVYELWLRTTSPAVKWGPREAARTFKTRGEARRALAALQPKDRAACNLVPAVA